MQIISRPEFPIKITWTKTAFIERFQDLLIGRCVVHGDPIEWTIYEIEFSNAIKHQPWRTQIDSNWVRKERVKAHSTVSNAAAIQWRRGCILCTVSSAQAGSYDTAHKSPRAVWTCNTYFRFAPKPSIIFQMGKKAFWLLRFYMNTHAKSLLFNAYDDVIIIVTFQKLMGFSGMQRAWRKVNYNWD